MLLSALPSELIVNIVGHLHDDRTSLKAISLVSTKFCEPCQVLAFSSICIPPRKKRCGSGWGACLVNHLHQIETLIDTLQRKPHLAWHVRTLEIYDHTGYRLGDPRRTNVSNGINSFVRLLDVLPIDRIHDLSISFEDTGYRFYIWNLLSKSVATSIIRCCQSTSLSTIRLRRAPVELIKFCGPSLRHIYLRNTTRELVGPSLLNDISPSSPPVHEAGRGIRLKTFSAFSFPDLCNILRLKQVSLDDLDSLSMSTLGAGREPQETIDRSRSSLQKLSFEIPYHGEPPSLSELRNLRTLQIRASKHQGVHYNACFRTFSFGTIAKEALKSLYTPSPLEELQIEMEYEDLGWEEDPYFIGPWRDMAMILSSETHFPRLQMISVSWMVTGCNLEAEMKSVLMRRDVGVVVSVVHAGSYPNQPIR